MVLYSDTGLFYRFIFNTYYKNSVCSNLLYGLLLLLSQASCPYAQKDTPLGQQRKREKNRYNTSNFLI